MKKRNKETLWLLIASLLFMGVSAVASTVGVVCRLDSEGLYDVCLVDGETLMFEHGDKRTEQQKLDWNSRLETAKENNLGEVERKLEKDIEVEKTKQLGLIAQLEGGEINVSSSAGIIQKIRQEQEVEQKVKQSA